MTEAVARSVRQRAMNQELARLESLFQTERVTSLPQMLQLPTGTRCNLRCIFCTDRGPAMAGQYRDLSLDEFIPFSDGLHWATVVQLWGWGEPFLNPEYGRIFDYVTGTFPGIEINISTNGTLFDAAWQRKLLEYGTYSLNVSINAASSVTYQRVCGADLFDRLVDNLTRFRELREQFRGSIQGRFTVSFVVVKENLHEIPAFIDLAASFGVDHVQFMDMMEINGTFPALSVRDEGKTARRLFDEAVARAAGAGITVGAFLPSAERDYLAMERYGGTPAPSAEQEHVALNPCFEPWRNMLVSSDGTATLCCRSGVVTGNLRVEGLAVWNSEVYQHYRKAVNSPEPPEVCRRCPVKIGISS